MNYANLDKVRTKAAKEGLEALRVRHIGHNMVLITTLDGVI